MTGLRIRPVCYHLMMDDPSWLDSVQLCTYRFLVPVQPVRSNVIPYSVCNSVVYPILVCVAFHVLLYLNISHAAKILFFFGILTSNMTISIDYLQPLPPTQQPTSAPMLSLSCLCPDLSESEYILIAPMQENEGEREYYYSFLRCSSPFHLLFLFFFPQEGERQRLLLLLVLLLEWEKPKRWTCLAHIEN